MRTLVIALTLVVLARGARADGRLTCNREDLNAKSYALTTRAIALAITAEGVTHAAERALELDPRNQMGHSVLARQYLILEDPERAEAAWDVVMRAGAPVVWMSTFYDVDGRDWFFFAVDRKGIRVYQWSQIARKEERGSFGILKYPGPEDERFWRAGGGCFESGLSPHAEVAWSDVREIKAGNWVLWFKLAKPVRITSDRNNKTKTLDELKVSLHGRTGELEVYKPVGEEQLAMRGRGPASYMDLIRRTLVKYVDPEKRIALPPLKPGVGW